MSNLFASQRAAGRRTFRRGWFRPAALPLRLEGLETRDVPSYSFPLSGVSWVQTGPQNISVESAGQSTSTPGNIATTGRVTGVVVNPTNPNIFYVGTADGGVARTKDGGTTWEMLTDRLPDTTPGLTDNYRTLAIGSITLSKIDPNNTIYAAEGEANLNSPSGDVQSGNGILKSTDGGNTWQLITGDGGTSPTAFVNTTISQIITVQDKVNPAVEHVFAAVQNGPTGSSVWRSDDGGATWVKLTSSLNSSNGVPATTNITDIAVDPSNPNVMYVATYTPFVGQNLTNGVYKTTAALSSDGTGTSYTIVFGGLGTGGASIPSGALISRIRLALAPSSPSSIYVSAGATAGVFRSLDSGINFQKFATTAEGGNLPGFGVSNYTTAIAVDPTNANRVILGGSGSSQILYTENAQATNSSTGAPAATWSNLSLDAAGQGPHNAVHALFFGPLVSGADRRQIWATTDGGVFQTVSLTAGGNGTVTPDWVSANGEAGPYALNVTQYNGIGLSSTSPDTYLGGTQASGTTLFTDPGTQIASVDLNGNATQVSSAYAQSVVDGGATDNGDTVYDFVNPQTAYHVTDAGAANLVQKSTDGGNTWAAASTGITNPQYTTKYPPLTQDPSTASTLYLGTDALNVTTNGATSWSQLLGLALPFVTNVTPVDGGPKPVVTSIGVSRSNPYVVYIAVINRGYGSPVVSYGPAIYEMDTRRLSAAIAEPAWHDISPFGTPTDGGNSTGRGTAPAFDASAAYVGLTMPPITGAAPAPAPNDLNFFEKVTALTVDSFDWRIVYATTDEHRIFMTTDGGAHWHLMNTTGLPDGATQQSFNDIAIDPNQLTVGGQVDDDIYVATAIGVYKLTNPIQDFSTQVWTRVGTVDFQTTAGVTTNGYQPDARVDDLEINTTLGILAAGTHGRGVWQYSIRPYVSGTVYVDTNGDGVNASAPSLTAADPEPAIPDIRVVANNVSSSPSFEAANTTTDARGFYVFRSLPNASYTIAASDKDGAGNETLASTAVVDTTQYQITTPPRTYVPIDQTVTDPVANIGLFLRTSISGVKFDDLNGDGVQESGEPGLPGVTIQLLRSDTNAVVDQTTTDANGNYSFTGLGVVQATAASNIDPTTGNPVPAYTVVPYRVREVLPNGYVQATLNPADITLTSGTAVTGVDFGNFKLVSVSGEVFEDTDGNGVFAAGEPGIAGVAVLIYNTSNLATPVATATTDANGNYTFSNLGPGTYRVRAALPGGYEQTSTDPADVTVVSGQNVTGDDFGGFRAGGFAGVAYLDVNGNGVRDAGETTAIPGATVELLGVDGAVLQTTTTDATGAYEFSGLYPLTQGNTVPYEAVVVSPDAYAQTSTASTVFVTSNTIQTGKDIGLFQKTTVSGVAFEDTNGNGTEDAGEPPLAGGTVTLANSATGAVVATTTTDGNGDFTFTGVGPATDGNGTQVGYTVSTNPAGYVLTTPAAGPILLTSGVPYTGITIGLFKTVPFTGRAFIDTNGNGVADSGEAGDPGRTIQLVNTATGNVVGTTTTDANGIYSISAGPGTYTLREVAVSGFVQTSADPGNTTLTSGETVPTTDFGSFKLLTVSGLVFNDLNADGTNQSGDAPLAGWTVRLVRGSDGSTVATQTTTANGTFTFTNVGPGSYTVTETVQSPYLPSVSASITRTTTSGQNVSLLFGNYAPGTAAGRVFEDLDKSGTVSGSEAGVSGFAVQILNAAGVTVGTATTDAAGNFSVGALTPGTYSVTVTVPTGWVRTSAATPSFTVTSGQTVSVGNIGVLKLGSIAGSVFLDTNRDGVRQSFEKGLAGSTVVLLNQSGSQIASQQVGADGSYLFQGLQFGTYTVELQSNPTGLTVSGPAATGQRTVAVHTGSTDPANAITGQDFGLTGRQRYAIGADGGGGPRVQVYDAESGQLLQDFFVYEATFTGGVRVAEADVNGDGIDDLIVAAGPGGGPRVRVFDGATGSVLFDKFVYEPTFNAGLYVTGGDVNGDGYADIVTGTSAGGAPRVTVYSGKDGSQIADYFAYDSNFRGGVRIGSGDVNGDGVAEVITAPGPGMAADVITWGGGTAGGTLTPLVSFLAFDASYTGGAFVAGGSVGTSGRADVIVGSGQNYPTYPVARTFNGQTGDLQIEVPAFGPAADGTAYTSEVRVASFDVNGDNVPDLVLASGPGSPPRIRFLDGRNQRQIGGELQPYEASFTGGIYIG